MSRAALKNFHLPLPGPLYGRLREQARRARQPATEWAREAIARRLDEIERMHLGEAIAEYAARHAGSRSDFDPDLERASLETLRGEGRRRK